MKKMLTNNLGLKLLSVVAAMMLWFIVVSIDDPVVSHDFSNIRVTMLNEDAVTSRNKVYKIEEGSDVISVRVRAKRSVLRKLSAENFTATADMEKNIKFGNLVGIEVSCSNKNVRSSDITKSRENVVISIEDASSEQFNVIVKQQKLTIDNGYVVGTVVPDQSLIRINGPASLVAGIKRVEVEVDANGYTSDFSKICSLKIIDNNEEQMDTTYLEYNGKTEGIKVSVTMLKKKQVRLQVGHTGTPADGYSIAGISYRPETLEIAGDEEIIEGIREIVIPDEKVNVDGITSNLQLTLDITEDLPAGIRLVDADSSSVAVIVEVEKKQGKTVRIPVSKIELRNVPRGLEADFGNLKEVELIVMGTSSELAGLKEDEIAVLLDLDKYSKTGSYTEMLEVTLPGNFSLLDDVEVEFKLVKGSSGRAGETEEDSTGSGTDTEEGGTTGGSTTDGSTEGSTTTPETE